MKNKQFHYFSAMKRIYLSLLLVCLSLSGFSNSFYFAWDGIGFATRYNYDLGMSYGAYYYRGVARGLGLGTYEFYQTFNTYYSREVGASTGQSIRAKVQYRFFSPMIVVQLGPRGQSQMYFTGGIGELQSGAEAIQNKWSSTTWSGERYDSTIDFSDNLSKYVVRMGFGFTQFMRLGGNFHLFVNEDFGFLANPIADVSTRQFAGAKTNANQFFMPTYFSIRAGVGLITWSKKKKHPWRIYPGKEED